MHTGSCHVAERGDGGCLTVILRGLTEQEERLMGGEGESGRRGMKSWARLASCNDRLMCEQLMTGWTSAAYVFLFVAVICISEPL